MILQSIVNIARICAAQHVRHIVLSPGSRCAPLTLAFVRHPDIDTKTVSDERAAAFIGLGMARQMRKPVGLVCTSGSAAYNYAPAVAEAFFQHIPLIIFTADRPPEWIDQLDGQTIRQRELYGRHVKASYELPVGQSDADHWYAGRIVAEAINTSQAYPMGPVHINVPVREPFYPAADETMTFTQPVKMIEQVSGEHTLSEEVVRQLVEEWQQYPKKLLVGGQQWHDPARVAALQRFSKDQQIPVVGDIISNLHGVAGNISHADVFLAQMEKKIAEVLQPDLLITVGLSVISKNLKLFLRKHPPRAHWHIQPAGVAADTFQSLSKVVHCQPSFFFSRMEGKPKSEQQTIYFQDWQQQEQRACQFTEQLFKGKSKYPSNEFQAVQEVLQYLPNGANLHLANSMAVRYANLIGLSKQQKEIEVFANRGTSGIDGSNSTAVGSALASTKVTVLLTGDMAFFYDRNAFWHRYALPNLHIVILNNQGGGIFRMIEGPSRQPELEEYFETMHDLIAENTAADFHMDYQRVDLRQEEGDTKLKSVLAGFFHSTSVSAKVLEIMTDRKSNAQVFNQYKNLIQQNYGA